MPDLIKQPQVSEEFERAFSANTGTSDSTCELCGRRLFGGSGTIGYEDGELEDLRQKAKAEPDKYHEFDGDDGVSEGLIDGKRFIFGCPCNRLRRYEDFVWAHRRQIIEYLKKRIGERLQHAQQESEAINRIDS